MAPGSLFPVGVQGSTWWGPVWVRSLALPLTTCNLRSNHLTLLGVQDCAMSQIVCVCVYLIK